jgi:hypothetical protein
MIQEMLPRGSRESFSEILHPLKKVEVFLSDEDCLNSGTGQKQPEPGQSH